MDPGVPEGLLLSKRKTEDPFCLDFCIFSGGGILKKEILELSTKFVHFHPGIVPNYRGSTCFYYSILNDDECGVTAFIMEEGLDVGDVICKKNFKKLSLLNNSSFAGISYFE